VNGWLEQIKKKNLDDLVTWQTIRGGINADKRSLIDNGYRYNSIASACIQMVATSLPEAAFEMFQDIKGDDDEKIETHWLLSLIQHPNDYLSTFELWELTTIHMLTGGAAYWLLLRDGDVEQGPVNRLELLRPDLVKEETDAVGNTIAYLYRPEGTSQEFRYPVYQVLKIPFPDPLDPSGSLSPLQRIVREIGIDNAATDFTKQFFDNGAVLAGLITSDQDLRLEEADALEKRWYQKFGRWAKGVFRTAVLGKGATYQQMALNFKDMEFESVRSLTETRICGAFGVDPVLLPSWVGIKYGGKYSNYQEARAHMWDETIIPMLRRIESKINSQLLIYEEGIYCRFSTANIQALQENENDKWERVGKAFDRGIITLGTAQNLLGVPEDGEKAELYAYELRKQNNPFQDEEQQPQDEDGQPQQEDEEEKSLEIKAVDKDDFTHQVMKVQDKHEERIQSVMADFFGLAKGRVVDATRTGEKTLTTEQYIAILLGIEEALADLSPELRKQAEKVFREAFIGGGEFVSRYMDNVQFNPNDPELDEQLQNYVRDFEEKVMGTVKKEVLELVREAREKEWTDTKLRDEIRAKFNKYSKEHAGLIARTETIRMTNMGTALAYMQSGFFSMEWHAIHDKKTCAFCKEMDGKVTRIGEPFAQKGDTIHATDEEGNTVQMKITWNNVLVPPLHPRCRCALLPR
jgi:HK97 family phage portal protein